MEERKDMNKTDKEMDMYQTQKNTDGNNNIEETPSEIVLLHRGEEGYPERLLALPHMPEELYLLGKLPREDLPTVGIVGARACSAYGRIQAFRYAREFSEAGVQVISGLASGIDSEGHKGALDGPTPTFAVMGCGVDVCYPRYNRGLYQRILRQGGGIVSEYPPGMPAMPHHFPLRNRIISGLSDIVLLVEARVKSGSLITASHAMEQGKSVYALPGAVNDPLSRGCHELIFDGAGIAYCPEVILSELGIPAEKQKEKRKEKKPLLTGEEKILYDRMEECKVMELDHLVNITGWPVEKVCSLLLQLILKNAVMETGRQQYLKQ